MRMLVKLIRGLFCVYALLLFIAGMFCVLPFVIVFSFQEPKKGGNNIYRVCRYWDIAWMTLVGLRYSTLYESVPDTDRQYVFVSNHISYLDIPLILRAIRLHRFRILGKAEMQKVPVFGYIYSRAVVMVDRSNSHGRSRSVRELRSVLSQGISVFIFPEGTFNETRRPLKDFYDGAFRIAIETQTPIQPLLFLGTYEQMHYSSIFCLRPGRTRAVYLRSVPVKGLTLNDLPALREEVYRLMEKKLFQYGAPWTRT